MIRRFGTTRGVTTATTMVHALFPSFVACGCLRTFVTSEDVLDKSIAPEDLLQLLGFKESDNPTKRELSVAFKRQLTKLVNVTRSVEEQSRIDRQRGAASVIEPDSETEELAKKLLRSEPGEIGSDDNSSKAEALRRLADKRVANLISAYRQLSNTRYKYLYDSSFDATMDVQLGYRRADTHFANFDSRRQEFFFSRSEAKPLGDYTSAYERTVDLDTTDLENAITTNTLLTSAAAATAGGSVAVTADQLAATLRSPRAGTTVQFVLTLDFTESFTGCTKEIAYQRREACKVCTGSGCRRQRASRCGQCAGRGQLQLPSGSYVVPKKCGICLGTGSVLPPECAACKGTGLGILTEHRRSITVAPGVANGERITLRGAGHAGACGGPAGNCVVTVVVKQHRFFNRDGADLHVIVPVLLSVVLGGGHISVPALDDHGRSTFLSVSLNNNNNSDYHAENNNDTAAPPRNQQQQPMLSDRVVVLSGHGMWRTNSSESPHTAAGSSSSSQPLLTRGNLYVHCVGVTPRVDQLTKAQRAVLLEHFAADEDVAPVPLPEGKQREEQHPDATTARNYNEEDFALAKDLCRHWLP